jgi:hypothetical protein
LKYYELSKKAKNKNPRKSLFYLSFATHYFQDLGIPFHTSLVKGALIHVTYENYVSFNWNEGHNFCASAINADKIKIDNLSDALYGLATFSHSKVDDLFSFWKNSDEENIAIITRELLDKITGYTIGFYELYMKA